MDISAILDGYNDSWRDYWDENSSQYENSVNLLSRAIALPNQDIQLPIAVCYAWTNAKWARVLPCHLAYGPEGSGKSTIAKFARGLRNAQSFGDGSTFASIRNYLQSVKYGGDEDEQLELDGACLILDNVYQSTFEGADNKLRSLVLCGYKKADDRLTIANPGTGTNFEFRTFSTKLFSSVEPLHESSDLRELRRRLLFTFHKKWESMTDDERPSFEMEDRVDFDDLDWSGCFEEAYLGVYGLDAASGQMGAFNVHEYGKFRKSLKACRAWPQAMTSERREISVDVMATGRLIGAWETTEEARRVFGEYWEWVDSKVAGEQSDLSQAMGEIVSLFEAASEATGKPAIVPTATINSELSARYDSGQFLERPKPKDIKDWLTKNGYKPSKNGSQSVWIKSL